MYHVEHEKCPAREDWTKCRRCTHHRPMLGRFQSIAQERRRGWWTTASEQLLHEQESRTRRDWLTCGRRRTRASLLSCETERELLFLGPGNMLRLPPKTLKSSSRLTLSVIASLRTVTPVLGKKVKRVCLPRRNTTELHGRQAPQGARRVNCSSRS